LNRPWSKPAAKMFLPSMRVICKIRVGHSFVASQFLLLEIEGNLCQVDCKGVWVAGGAQRLCVIGFQYAASAKRSRANIVIVLVQIRSADCN
jgi:hypothetical protein